MGCNLDLCEGWQLGWFPAKATQWRSLYNYWEVKDACLWGRKSDTGYQARIYANCAPEGDYDFSCGVSIPDEAGEAAICLLFSAQRLAFYSVQLKPGSRIQVHYIFSDLFDHTVLENCGPELEAGKRYEFRAEIRGSKVKLFIDNEDAGEFTASSPCGRYTMLCVNSREASFGNVTINNPDGQSLYQDDFSENSLPDFVNVELEDIKVHEWIPAVVPGTVHTALVRAGTIENPYYGFSGSKQVWVDDQNWVYTKRFSVPAAMKGKTLYLVFDGVDYRAHFWLNGKKLCYHEGMFGGPNIDITDSADYEHENELVVCIQPCPCPPHNNVRPFILHRWHFNMDIITVGLWRKVQLRAYDRILLADPQVITTNLEGTKALVEVNVSLINMAMWPFEVQGRVVLRSPVAGDPEITTTFAPGFSQGALRVCCMLEVPDARLWWPNGMGEQYLYDVEISADLFEHGKPAGHDEIHFKTGLRTLRMEGIPAPGTPAYPEKPAITDPFGLYNWRLCINGRPFFAKGSNWMPIDQMLDISRERYAMLLGRARDCNINILRPWGAGLLETDDFYEVCDELGICIWQDTLMANGFYDKSDIRVWRQTMRTNVARIRNHPSLVIWCGGNEFDPDCAENKDIIDEIESIITELDPTREFHRACPYGGDSHSYLVNWMGGMDYTFYTRDISIAVTEFSMASPPSMETLKKMIPEEELNSWPPDLPDNIDRWGYAQWGTNVQRRESHFSIHDAHLSSITNVMLPPMSDCGIPQSWEEFVRYTQTAHGLLTQFGNDCWRSRWPYCTMSMSWVFNVIFPDTMSWSYVDYFGLPKRSYYYKKRSLEPLHAGAVFEKLFNPQGSIFNAKLFVINETLEHLRDCSLKVRLYDCTLVLLDSWQKPVNIPGDDVKRPGVYEWKIPADMKDGVLFLCIDLVDNDGNLLSRSQYCPRVGSNEGRMPCLHNGPWIKDVEKIRTELKASVLPDGCIRITNTGQVPAFGTSLETPVNGEYLTFSDNYFWLESAESRDISIINKGPALQALEVSAWNADTFMISEPLALKGA